MTKYEYLLSKKENGELSMLFELGLPVHLVSYMENLNTISAYLWMVCGAEYDAQH